MTEQVPSEERCNCPSGSYHIKHTDACYKAQIERLRKDAERYRWLRHGDNDEAVVRMSGNKRNNYPFLLRNEELDAVIDAKMKEQP